MKYYQVTIKHDTGTVRIGVVANTLSDAIRKVCAAENAPESAVIKVVKAIESRKDNTMKYKIYIDLLTIVDTNIDDEELIIEMALDKIRRNIKDYIHAENVTEVKPVNQKG